MDAQYMAAVPATPVAMNQNGVRLLIAQHNKAMMTTGQLWAATAIAINNSPRVAIGPTIR
jgi:hypothetical protein